MVIRRSSLGEVKQLIADLGRVDDDAPVRREAAVARLRVIGARAVRQVLDALADPAPAAVRVALLSVLEGRREAGVTDAVLSALGASEPEVRAAAVPAARALLDDARGAEVLERVTALAAEPSEPLDVRLAALAALRELPSSTIAPLMAALATDREPAIRLASAPRAAPLSDEPGAELEDAAAGAPGAEPRRILDALARDGAAAALTTLHRLVTVSRDRERAETGARRREDWLALRGTLHQILAQRGSRVALYDLREAIRDARAPLPETFLSAMAAVGDGDSLEAIGAAYVRSSELADAGAWRAALVDAARAIIARERLTPRHAAIKRLHARWGSGVGGLV